MLRNFICALFAILALAAGMNPALADKRVALVIGNSAYKHASELANPRNDAADMAAALKRLGVMVIEGTDLDKPGMDRAIKSFAAALSGADVGVFFYAGHGLQVNGSNYLVPVDAELTTSAALEFEMVRMDLVQRLMEGEAKTNLVFLDACRNNPLSRNLARAMGTRSGVIGQGLAAAESGVGTLISYSTNPGNVALDGAGRNSPYSGALVKALTASNDDVIGILTKVRNDVMAATADKQVPWENHSLRSRFFFRQPVVAVEPPQASLAPASPARSASAGGSIDPERAWAATKDTKDGMVLESFLRRFGDSFYADLARSRLGEINSAAPPPATDIDKEIVTANRSIVLDPRNDQAYRLRGDAYYRKNEFDRAVVDFSTAIDLNPASSQAYFGRGRAYNEKAYYDNAITDFNKVIEMDPSDASAFNNRGVAYEHKKEYARSVVDFSKAVELQPKRPLYFSNRGISRFNIGEYPAAMADFNTAAELEPTNGNTFHWICRSALNTKEYNKATAACSKAIELNPGDRSNYYNRGRSYELSNAPAPALVDYNKYLELDPKDPDTVAAIKRVSPKP